MSGVWSVAALVLLPIPLTFLLLLSLPTPVKVRKIIMGICAKTLAIQSFGALTLFHFMMIVSALTFAGQVYATHQNNMRYQETRTMDLSPCEKTQLLADKWRHERNFWMAALAVTLWIVLNRFYSLNQKNLDLHDRNLVLTNPNATPSAPPMPSKMDPLADKLASTAPETKKAS